MRYGRQLVALLLLGLGCEIDGSIGRDGPSGTGMSGGSASGAEGQATEDPGDGTGGGGSAGSVGGGTGGGSGEEGGSSEVPTDAPAICHPTPDDEACARCRKVSCCPFYEACVAHDACLCWWDCVVTDHTTAQCVEQCDSDGVLYAELQACVQMSCDSCPATDTM